ncbi:MAG: holo-ACP synthase [Acidimicrobiales bacterium]
MIGIGTDLVELARFREAIERTPSLVSRLFTDAERAYADQRSDPTERYAARFAAKEAAMKALGLGLGGLDWHDVEVVRNDDTGAPSLMVTGRAAERAGELGVERWLVTLSHTETLAQAIVVAL